MRGQTYQDLHQHAAGGGNSPPAPPPPAGRPQHTPQASTGYGTHSVVQTPTPSLASLQSPPPGADQSGSQPVQQVQILERRVKGLQKENQDLQDQLSYHQCWSSVAGAAIKAYQDLQADSSSTFKSTSLATRPGHQNETITIFKPGSSHEALLAQLKAKEQQVDTLQRTLEQILKAPEFFAQQSDCHEHLTHIKVLNPDLKTFTTVVATFWRDQEAHDAFTQRRNKKNHCMHKLSEITGVTIDTIDDYDLIVNKAKEMKTAKGRTESLESNVATLQELRNVSRITISTLRSQLDERNKALKNTETRLAETTEAFEKARNKLEKKNMTLNNTEARLAEATEALEKVRNKLEKENTTLNNAEARLTETEEKLRNVKEELEEANTSRAGQSATIEALTRELTELTGKYKSLLAEASRQGIQSENGTQTATAAKVDHSTQTTDEKTTSPTPAKRQSRNPRRFISEDFDDPTLPCKAIRKSTTSARHGHEEIKTETQPGIKRKRGRPPRIPQVEHSNTALEEAAAHISEGGEPSAKLPGLSPPPGTSTTRKKRRKHYSMDTIKKFRKRSTAARKPKAVKQSTEMTSLTVSPPQLPL